MWDVGCWMLDIGCWCQSSWPVVVAMCHNDHLQVGCRKGWCRWLEYSHGRNRRTVTVAVPNVVINPAEKCFWAFVFRRSPRYRMLYDSRAVFGLGQPLTETRIHHSWEAVHDHPLWLGYWPHDPYLSYLLLSLLSDLIAPSSRSHVVLICL